MDLQEQADRAKRTLASHWWGDYRDRLNIRIDQIRIKLENGSETRLEDRQRGALAALRWARDVVYADAKLADKPPGKR